MPGADVIFHGLSRSLAATTQILLSQVPDDEAVDVRTLRP
jgi:hypothetical protein